MFLQAELRRRHRRRTGDDAGFTLLEVVVALLVLTLVGSGTVLLLASGSRSATAARLYTAAKDLAVQRVEAMRTLQYHVDRQNGPYIDLLDLYYTNLSTTSTTRTRGAITDSSQTETQKVRWFSSGTAPNPTSGPFYQVSVSNIPGYTSFSQTIDTQFLNAAGSPLPASSFATGGTYAGYNSQTEGSDAAPTGLVGVTITTSWKVDGQSKSYTLTTRITDASSTSTYITSQGVGEYLRITSYGPYATSDNADALTVDVNRAEADGSLTTGSSATANVTAFEAEDDGQGTDVLGATGQASSPGSTTSTTSPNGVIAHSPVVGAPGCSWAAAGQSTAGNVTAATTNGLPQVPSTVGAGAMVTSSLSEQTVINCNAQNGIKYAMWFDNQSSSTSLDSHLGLNANNPLVGIQDSSGSTAATTGAAWVNASSATTTPHTVTSGASVTSPGGNAAVGIFPGLSYVTDHAGLVTVKVTSASLSCTSTVPSGGGSPTFASSASYTATVTYWAATDTSGNGHRVSTSISWSSAGTSSGSLPALTTVVYQKDTTKLTLGDYISNWSNATSITEQPNNGLHQIPGVLAITTEPVRSAASDPSGTSAIGLEVGALSCVAADNR